MQILHADVLDLVIFEHFLSALWSICTIVMYISFSDISSQFVTGCISLTKPVAWASDCLCFS